MDLEPHCPLYSPTGLVAWDWDDQITGEAPILHHTMEIWKAREVQDT